MGDLDQFAKQTFAEETILATHGAMTWELPPELRLSDVRLDGLLLVHAGTLLVALPSPWSEARAHAEIVVELEMQGDHLDAVTLQRALLRRQARQVRLTEAAAPGHQPEVPLWMVTSHVPGMLRRLRDVRPLADGCYEVRDNAFSFLWIAANELPLLDELIPFLIARSGTALDEFALWVRTRRSPDWLSRMLQFLPMSLPVQEEILRYMVPLTDDPEIRARQRHMARFLAERLPEVREGFVDEGREQGLEQGLEPLVHLFERRLTRKLTEAEHGVLHERLTRLGANRLGDVVLDLSADALDTWLGDPNAT